MKKKMIIAAMTVSMFSALSGCSKAKLLTTIPAPIVAEMPVGLEDDAPFEEKIERTQSFEKTDFPIKKCKLSGADALYEIQAADLGISEFNAEMISWMGNNLIVGYHDNGTKISIIDPMNLKIKKTLDVSSALDNFNLNCDFERVYVQENGIAIISDKLNKVLFYNPKLNLTEEVPVVCGNNPVLISEDLKKIIWDNESGTEIYVYNRNSKETKTVCKELVAKNTERYLHGYDSKRDLLYFSVPADENCVEYDIQVWDMNTDTVVATLDDDTIFAPIFDDQYICYAATEGFIIQDRDSLKKNVLIYNSFDEETSNDIDAKSKMICTSEIYATATDDNNVVFRIYDFDGFEKYETELVTKQNEQRVKTAIVNDQVDYSAMMIDDGSSTHLYIWDLLGENVQCKEQENYLYDFDSLNEEKNDEKIERKMEALEKKYGFRIQLADEESKKSNGHEVQLVHDKRLVLHFLNDMERAFSRYPDGMLQQMNSKVRNGITIYLSGVIRLIEPESDTSSCFGFVGGDFNHVRVYYDITCNDTAVIYHELMHVIDYSIIHLRTVNDDYDITMHREWIKLNPDGFAYTSDWGSAPDDYTALKSEDPNEWYFAYQYGKRNDDEDIATVMEMALDEQLHDSGRFESPVLRKKLALLSRYIRKEYDTTGWPEKTAWELLLK